MISVSRLCEYGKSDTKRSITNIVTNVAKAYKFTSLPELNAVLNLYNVTAYRGTKESVMYKNGGLNYWITNEKGMRIGVPIKASSIYQKPTLKLLEDRFKLNEFLRKPFKESLKRKIDTAKNLSVSMDQFRGNLKKQQITVVIRQNSEGRVYGLSYIDLMNKAVFNGSDLGKVYSAGAVIDALKFSVNDNTSHIVKRTSDELDSSTTRVPLTFNNSSGRSLLDDLLNPQETNQGQPNQFGPKKKRKRRRNLNL
jgi:hypothetical protein